jgi:hypothetical protein
LKVEAEYLNHLVSFGGLIGEGHFIIKEVSINSCLLRVLQNLYSSKFLAEAAASDIRLNYFSSISPSSRFSSFEDATLAPKTIGIG